MSDNEDGLEMFQEPAGYFEPEKPETFQEHTMRTGRTLRLRFVGHNPLWVRLLFPHPALLDHSDPVHVC